ncbi:hypothetical protein EB061_06415 [bacterium]|nr:hypothetical protein [bacterium]
MAAPPSSVSIGSPITGLQIKAVDSFGNTVSSFGGAATISSSDGFASLPSAGSVTFSSGISTAFNVTLNSIGSFTITGASGSLSVTSSPISASGTAPTFTCDDSWGAVPLNPTVNATPTTTNLWLNPSTLVSDASYHYGWKPVCDYSTSGAYVSSVECPVLTAVSGGGTYGTYSSSTACMQNGDSAASFVKRIDQHSTTPLANVIALGTGPVNTCAIGGASSSATSGQVYCTGDNSVGQLGTGVIGLGATHLIPVPGLSSVRQISVGPATVCAVVDDSTTVTAVKCWGDNSYQQLGSGSVAMSATPVTVSIPLASGSSSEYITQVSVDGFPLGATACAVSNLNNVYCWGSNNYHQFGNGSLSSSPLSPQRAFKNASGAYYAVSKIVTNGIATCGLLTSGTAVCSGKNPSSTASGAYNYSHYMLSNSSINTIALDFAGAANPVNVEALASSGTALSNLTDISLGHNNGCVRQSSSAGDLAYCWGNGYSSTGPVAQVAAQPVQTAASTTLTGVSRVMVGYDQICAFISGSSTPYCLGQNRHNVFAIGSGTGTTYVQYATALSAYAGATQLAVTSYDAPHLCMIASSGGVSNGATCNGPNWNGQLGNERIGSYGGASPIYYTPDWMKK